MGKVVCHRRRRVLLAGTARMSKGSLRRLARRGGVKRMSSSIFQDTEHVLREFLRETLRNSVVFMEHARRKTLTLQDVVYALKHQGNTLYGF
jgi:histone H4